MGLVKVGFIRDNKEMAKLGGRAGSLRLIQWQLARQGLGPSTWKWRHVIVCVSGLCTSFSYPEQETFTMDTLDHAINDNTDWLALPSHIDDKQYADTVLQRLDVMLGFQRGFLPWDWFRAMIGLEPVGLTCVSHAYNALMGHVIPGWRYATPDQLYSDLLNLGWVELNDSDTQNTVPDMR